MKCLLLKNNRNLRKSNASAQKLFLNSDRSGNNNGMENCHCCSEFYLSNMHYMHDKMIGRVSFIITGIILSIHGLCKISYAKCGTMYKRSTIKSILMGKKTWGSKREKSEGTALQKKSCLMPEKKYVGLQLDEKVK